MRIVRRDERGRWKATMQDVRSDNLARRRPPFRHLARDVQAALFAHLLTRYGVSALPRRIDDTDREWKVEAGVEATLATTRCVRPAATGTHAADHGPLVRGP